MIWVGLSHRMIASNIIKCLNGDTPLVEKPGVRVSIQSVRFILSVLVGLNPVEIVFQNVY